MMAAAFHILLLRWFDQHGRKNLPWQQNKTPFRVWISEVMLQQTQVNTVIPYFNRFMARFPDIFTLAKAQADEVLHLWSGLGYYSRARNLHQTAKIVVEQYQGKFPHTLIELEELPGIGLSTAGAILAIAFQQKATILDGNVKRVLARFHGIKEAVNEKNTEKKLWKLAEKYTPTERIADYTQAMMDLGATLCIRSKPRCEHCPLSFNCIAYQEDIVSLLPFKKAARTLPVRQATFLIVKKEKEIFLQKRPSSGIWGGLWSLPEIAGEPEKKLIKAFCQKHFHLTRISYQPQLQFRHTFTHYHLDIYPIVIQIKNLSPPLMTNDCQIWYNPYRPQTIGLPKPIQTILMSVK